MVMFYKRNNYLLPWKNEKSGEKVMGNTSLEIFKIMIAYLYIFYFPYEQRLQKIVRKWSNYIVTTTK